MDERFTDSSDICYLIITYKMTQNICITTKYIKTYLHEKSNYGVNI